MRVLFAGLIVSTSSSGSTSFQPIQSILRELKRRAESENRKIIAYSEHEANMARRYAQIDLLPVYKNARIIAESMSRHDSRRDHSATQTLKDHLALLDFEYPPQIGVGQATTRLRIVQESIRQYGNYERCPESVKREWRNLLEYNRLDCVGMKYLVQKAVGRNSHQGQAA